MQPSVLVLLLAIPWEPQAALPLVLPQALAQERQQRCSHIRYLGQLVDGVGGADIASHDEVAFVQT